MPEIITNHDAHYAYEIVKTICTEVGPGLPGSSQERDRAAIIKQKLESHLGAGNVVVEEFTVAPGAFLGSLPMSAIVTLTAALLNISIGRFTGVSAWLTAMPALVLSTISVLAFIFEFILYFELVDPLFRKKQLVNVIGTLRRPGTKNVNGAVKNSPEMVKSVVAAAERAGVPYKVKPYPLCGGGSDAGSFSQAGLKATTLLPLKVPQQIVAFLHQKWDGPEILSIVPLSNVLKLALEWVRDDGE